jgi:hypothetical protein
VRRARSLAGVGALLSVFLGVTAIPSSAGPTVARTFVTMYSQSGDYIGQGADRLFTRALGSVSLSGDVSTIGVSVSGGTSGDAFDLAFAAPAGTHLKPGTYLGAQRLPFQTSGHPGIDVSGDGRGCNEIEGRFDVRDITKNAAGEVTRLWVLYEQHCEGAHAALFGEVMVNVQQPVGPFFAASSNVWFPDTYRGVHSAVVPVNIVATGVGTAIAEVTIAGRHHDDYEIRVDTCSGVALPPGDICQVLVRFTPSKAGPRTAVLIVRDGDGLARRIRLDGLGIGGTTSITLESDAGDYIGGGHDETYLPSNSIITVSGNWRRVSGGINSTEGDWWSFDFEAPDDDVLAPGTTFDATRFPFNGTGAGMDFTGNGRGCNEITGTFTVNDFSPGVESTVRYLSLDFEQHCEGLTPALHGEIRYRMPGADRTAPAAPTGLSVSRNAAGTGAHISWTNPASGFAYVVVRYSLGGVAPILPTTQFAAYAGSGVSVSVWGLRPGRRISISVFAVDGAGNVGPRARVVRV